MEWEDISIQFDTDMRLLHGLPEKPQLISLINAGMSALKTPKCKNEGFWESNINCPVCSSPLEILAKKLPLAHLETSVLVCPINGTVMDSDNTPVALPNGHVYSYSALQALSDPIDGKIVCPRSNSVFHISDARKCFIS